MKDSLGDRMKLYENVNRNYLMNRCPVILRIDGRAFHTLTRACDKPFDLHFIKSMEKTAERLIKDIQGCKAVYVQSDEISLFLTDYDELETDSWFKYNIQKMVSISASISAVEFTTIFGREGLFDSRVFNLPKEEVSNYFIWRYKDWLRNSLNMFARSFYSQKQLNGKKKDEIHKMLFEKGKNWANLSEQIKNGTMFFKGEKGVEKIFPKSLEEIRERVNNFL